jgi:DNA-binding CsgD family transcriptional regulator
MAPHVVGRRAERAALRAFLRRPARGLRAVHVQGEPGMGKTTLWLDAVAAAGRLGYLVLQARPAQPESRLSFAVLADLFAHPEPETVAAMAALPAGQGHGLEAALTGTMGQGARTWHVVGAAVLGLLRSLAAERPVVVAIDDIQWADPASLRVLAFALRRLHDLPVAVLTSQRTDFQRRGDDGDVRLAELEPTVLRVGPLPPPELTRLLAARAHLIPGPWLDRLAMESGGNPFVALEMARATQARGEQGWALPRVGRLALSSSLRTLVRSHIAALDDNGLTLAVVASALARPTIQLLTSAIGDAERVRLGLANAESAGILELRGDLVAFSHPLLAAALYETAARRDRRALHARLAGVVGEPEEHAWHLAHAAAGTDERAASALADAAAVAGARGAPDSALAMLTEAIARSDPAAMEELAHRRVEAARCLLILGRFRDALDQAVDVAGSPVSARTRSDAFHIAGLAALEVSGPVRAGHLIEEALALADDPPERVNLVLRYCALLWPLGRQAEVPGLLRRAIRLARSTHDDQLVARARITLLSDDFVAGRRSAASVLKAIHRAVGDLPTEPFPRWYHGNVAPIHQWADDPVGAQAHWQAIIEHSAETGNELARLEYLGYSADLAVRTGDWDRAVRAAGELTEMPGAAESPIPAAFGHAVLAKVAAWRGELGRAAASATRGLELGEPYPWLRGRNLAALGCVEMARGDSVAAAARLREAAQADPTFIVRRQGVCQVLFDLIEATAAAGALADANQALASVEAHTAVWGEDWARAGLARSRALVDAAEGQLANALPEAVKAVRLHERLPYPLELGRSLLVAGSIQRRLRHQREGRDALSRAERIFTDLGATPWRERAQAELGRIGGRSASPDALTSSEHAVAELVARGLSNAEVASDLVLAVRTVESHLTQIYAKLGVRSRTELARKILLAPNSEI